MKKGFWLLGLLFLPGMVFAAEILRPYGPVSLTEVYRSLNHVLLDAWPDEGQAFISFITTFKKYYALVGLGALVVFVLHYLIFGPKRFPETGQRVFYYGAFIRLIHWGAAASMSLLVASGLAVLFAKLLGGGALVLKLRAVHVGSAFVFAAFAVPLFFGLLKDMLPAPYDLKWFLVFGGYLSRRQRSVPAGKFNAGQKLWFWLGTGGGLVMFYTGYVLYQFEAPVSLLRKYLKVHLVLGLFVLALFLVHLYMSLLAVKGALRSMISGYKDLEEVAYMHPKYYEKVKDKAL